MIIFDLDHTLFDTDILKKDFCGIFGKHGICQEDFYKTFYESYNVDPETHGCYHFDKHCRILENISEQEKEEIKKELAHAIFSRGKSFLFSDTIPVLNYFKNCGEKLVLVTKGVDDFQNLKLKATGLDQYFKEVYIVIKSKFTAFEKKVGDEQIFHVNDRLDELQLIKEKCKNVVSVWINRNHKIEDIDQDIFELNDLGSFIELYHKAKSG